MTKRQPREVDETPEEWAARQIRERGPMPPHIIQAFVDVRDRIIARQLREEARDKDS